MKKFYLFTLLLLSCTNVFAEEDTSGSGDDPFGIGIGIGIPYGVFGANMNYKLNDIFDITAGLGIGYGAGIRIRPISSTPNFRITAFYGTNVVLLVEKLGAEDELETYEGFNLGIGYGKVSDGWDIDLVYAFVTQEAKDREKELEGQGYRNTGDDVENTLTLSFGYHW